MVLTLNISCTSLNDAASLNQQGVFGNTFDNTFQ